VTAKFDAFKAALHALCIEHGVRLCDVGEYDERGVSLCSPTEGASAGLDLCIDDDLPRTPDDLVAEEAARVVARAEHEKRIAEWRELAAARARERAEYESSPQYLAMVKRLGEEAAKTRREQLRVSTDPNDPAYVDDRPRRVKCNDVEITDWAVADEFRRCVIRKDGRVINGSVWIERLAAEPEAEVQIASVTPITDAGFVGMFVNVPDVSPVPMEPAKVEAPKPAPVKAKKRRR
jgi:hypothetical protein